VCTLLRLSSIDDAQGQELAILWEAEPDDEVLSGRGRRMLLPSTFTWLVYSGHEPRKMLDMIDLIGGRTTRDELGLPLPRISERA
jgi:hypothetical protein